MKIALVRPFICQSPLYPPFNLIALAPYFKDAKVEIYDLQVEAKFINLLKFDMVAFSCYTDQLELINCFANTIRSLMPNITIIAGGSGITSSIEHAKTVLKHVDLLVAGDGEEFATEWKKYSKYYGYFETKRFNFTEHKIPDWSLINWKKYAKTTGFAVETSRGCSFNCIFCTAHTINGKTWRPRKPEDVVNELIFLKKTYKCKKFYFTDDNATVDPKRWKSLMQQIIDAKLKIKLYVPEGIQAHHLDKETLQLMKDAGFEHIVIGAESGSQRVLDKVIDKGGLTLEKIEEVVKASVEIGLTVSCFFVIGIVGETLAEAEETVKFAEKMRKLGAYDCSVRNVIPIQGTRMYKIAKEKGYLVDEPNDLNTHQDRHLLRTPDWAPEEIMALVKRAKVEQTKHFLKRKTAHLLKKGLLKFFKEPRKTLKRFQQIRSEAKQ